MLDRLQVIQAALRVFGEDLQTQRQTTHTERKHQLARAAKALLPDYAAGGELTIFTNLDGEGFYVQG
jgi:hypothetical protein